MKFLNKKVNDCVQHIHTAEVHQFPRNSVMEFSQYLQWDRVAPFFAPPCIILHDGLSRQRQLRNVEDTCMWDNDATWELRPSRTLFVNRLVMSRMMIVFAVHWGRHLYVVSGRWPANRSRPRDRIMSRSNRLLSSTFTIHCPSYYMYLSLREGRCYDMNDNHRTVRVMGHALVSSLSSY